LRKKVKGARNEEKGTRKKVKGPRPKQRGEQMYEKTIIFDPLSFNLEPLAFTTCCKTRSDT
jgi:hypothetical protein